MYVQAWMTGYSHKYATTFTSQTLIFKNHFSLINVCLVKVVACL